ncbi:MAG: hypothetical protein KBG15_07060, partial [Kofleriaceae bacterium]|nr:hypothetical protein [Kofleriaceae bacterium]
MGKLSATPMRRGAAQVAAAIPVTPSARPPLPGPPATAPREVALQLAAHCNRYKGSVAMRSAWQLVNSLVPFL